MRKNSSIWLIGQGSGKMVASFDRSGMNEQHRRSYGRSRNLPSTLGDIKSAPQKATDLDVRRVTAVGMSKRTAPPAKALRRKKYYLSTSRVHCPLLYPKATTSVPQPRPLTRALLDVSLLFAGIWAGRWGRSTLFYSRPVEIKTRKRNETELANTDIKLPSESHARDIYLKAEWYVKDTNKLSRWCCVEPAELDVSIILQSLNSSLRVL